ncbi:MAG: DUF411 domain-containing protein [Methylobacteriaceae bacterium]|nr:DUF411 domain-containing protein [Methylobacteriaceae bacterium]
MSLVRLHRRALLTGALAAFAAPAVASPRPAMLVYKDPDCGCCGAWVEHLRAAGFSVEVQVEPRMNLVKARLRVPAALASCHTAQIDGYVVEGHVPAEAIDRLLAGRPKLAGLAVPGMPVGSPGMEVDGLKPEPFAVMGFAPDAAPRVFLDYPRGYRG